MKTTAKITYQRLNGSNFNPHSLDTFRRHQRVTECWRKISDRWQLVPMEFEENWDMATCREIAADVAAHMETDQSAFGAFAGEELVGFLTLSHKLFGTTARYAELVCFQVSEPWRGQGIGKALFHLAVREMEAIGAEKLYISAHSSRETQAAYKALGCVLVKEINREIAAGEPFDVQLEYGNG